MYQLLQALGVFRVHLSFREILLNLIEYMLKHTKKVRVPISKLVSLVVTACEKKLVKKKKLLDQCNIISINHQNFN